MNRGQGMNNLQPAERPIWHTEDIDGMVWHGMAWCWICTAAPDSAHAWIVSLAPHSPITGRGQRARVIDTKTTETCWTLWPSLTEQRPVHHLENNHSQCPASIAALANRPILQILQSISAVKPLFNLLVNGYFNDQFWLWILNTLWIFWTESTCF